jgi:16S rRNA (cytidine1402-2'-O)-methyltransferase
VIPTPVGNLEDITLRALRMLKESNLILAEDTRHSLKLLRHYGIEKPLLSYHKFNEREREHHILNRLKSGELIALISDSGTPGISDPGHILIKACIENGITVECLPGPTAFVPALVTSGLNTDRFLFYGFLPHKKGRQTALKNLADYPHTTLLYESPFRLLKLLEELSRFLDADRRISISREISKIYEETVRGTATELLQHFNTKAPKGEFVVVIEGRDD